MAVNAILNFHRKLKLLKVLKILNLLFYENIYFVYYNFELKFNCNLFLKIMTDFM